MPTDGPTPGAPPVLSVVVPCFNEESVLPAFHARLVAALGELGPGVEIVYVDDGSRDGTAGILRGLAAADPRVHYLVLRRNRGHQIALRAGLERARGEAVVSLDADLQHPPELVPGMLARWREGKLDGVLTQRRRGADESRFKYWTSRLFYSLYNRISDVPILPGSADFRLLGRRTVDDLLACGDQTPFFRGLVLWIGGRYEVLEYDAAPRAAGESKYGLRRMVLFALDGLFSFSLIPLRLMLFLSGGLLLLAFGYGIYALVVHLVLHQTVAGWTSMVGLQLVMFAYLSCFLAILGEYLGRIYLQSLRRPSYLVAESDAAGTPGSAGEAPQSRAGGGGMP